jgi:hypothetical protein
LETGPKIILWKEDMVIRVIAGTASVDDFDDLIISVAIWDSAGPFPA